MALYFTDVVSFETQVSVMNNYLIIVGCVSTKERNAILNGYNF